jgi:hypothetical protein
MYPLHKTEAHADSLLLALVKVCRRFGGGEPQEREQAYSLWSRSGADAADDDRGPRPVPIVISRIPHYCASC